jgi:hypothetical protein
VPHCCVHNKETGVAYWVCVFIGCTTRHESSEDKRLNKLQQLEMWGALKARLGFTRDGGGTGSEWLTQKYNKRNDKNE